MQTGSGVYRVDFLQCVFQVDVFGVERVNLGLQFLHLPLLCVCVCVCVCVRERERESERASQS